MIENRKTLIHPTPIDIIFCYSEYQPAYSQLSKDKNIRFIKGLEFTLDDSSTPRMIVIDDLMTSSSQNREVQELFTRGVHHSNTSVIFLTQNIFNQGKYARDMRLNTHYYCLFRSPSFLSQVAHIGRQLMPDKKNFILEAYKDATKAPYTYLLIILHPSSDDQLRVRAGILPHENEIIYLPS